MLCRHGHNCRGSDLPDLDGVQRMCRKAAEDEQGDVQISIEEVRTEIRDDEEKNIAGQDETYSVR